MSGALRLVVVWTALMALALATLLCSFAFHGPVSLSLALAFACTKAFLVCWFFMHLAHETAASRFAFLTGVIFVVLLVSFALGDVLLRPPITIRTPVPTRTGLR